VPPSQWTAGVGHRARLGCASRGLFATPQKGLTAMDMRMQAFIDAMTTAASIAAGVALLGALVAAAFLPSRALTEPDPDEAGLPEPALA